MHEGTFRDMIFDAWCVQPAAGHYKARLLLWYRGTCHGPGTGKDRSTGVDTVLESRKVFLVVREGEPTKSR